MKKENTEKTLLCIKLYDCKRKFTDYEKLRNDQGGKIHELGTKRHASASTILVQEQAEELRCIQRRPLSDLK